MADFESIPQPAGDSLPTAPRSSRVAIYGSLIVLIVFVAVEAPSLIREWTGLRRELGEKGSNQIVGYLGVDPVISFATPPDGGIRHEGDSILLWSGWTPGVGHGWFRVGRGDLDIEHIGRLGAAFRAIDHPIVEDRDGDRWKILWEGTPVAGLELNAAQIAYPIRILEKVHVVNDTLGGRPVLVVYAPHAPSAQAVSVYDPVLENRRLTLCSSGYYHNQRCLFYDRGTRSLWIAADQGLTAVSGQYKGRSLKLVRHLGPIRWSQWQGKHPESPLLVGADRSKPQPIY